jgi:toxin FitB
MWLVDTNVVSELGRGRPNPNVLVWMENTPLDSLYISDVSIAEIRFGTESSSDPLKRSALRQWLEVTVRPMFEQRTLPVTEQVLFVWRGLATSAQKRGKTISQADSLIAATAMTSTLRVCTRDTAPYQFSGLPVLNPWTGERFNGA